MRITPKRRRRRPVEGSTHALAPEFVPVLGYLDDLIIVLPKIMFAAWLVPAPLMADLRTTALLRPPP
jgi:hypothetical protein